MPALLALAALLPACGLRTPLGERQAHDAGRDQSPDAHPVDVPIDLSDSRRDVEPPPGPDLVPPYPFDTPPDRTGDLPGDLPRERGAEALPPIDSLPDVRPPIDSLPDVVPPIDRGPDRLRDLPPDLGMDSLVDQRGVDLIPPIQPDLPPLVDGDCTDGATLGCTCANGMSGNRVCLPRHTWSECACGSPPLMRLRNGVLGTWIGTATTPWVAPYGVTFTFDSYTHYSAHSLEGGNPALYYGTDEDSPEKKYDITDIQDNGDGVGIIDVVFGPGNFTRQVLSGIALSADGNTLTFWYLEGGTHGPLQYDLQRAPQ